MLDTTLATTFVPGTNLKGEVAGANWTFLLPSLELDAIVCLGMPSAGALTTLSRLGQVTIIVGKEELIGARENDIDLKGSANTHVLIRNNGMSLPLPDKSADLIVLTASVPVRSLANNQALQTEIQRILKEEGLVYLDLGGPVKAARNEKLVDELAASLGPANYFWVTPLRGEIHTAVPLQHQETIDYFLDNGFDAPSIDESVFRNAKRLLKQRRAKTPSEQTSSEAVARPRRRSRPGYWPLLRATGKGLLQGLQHVERFALKKSRFIRRRSAYIGKHAPFLSDSPPQYLGTLAQEAGIDTRNFDWGLVARGDYSSRKVLFFMFAREETRSGGLEPTYVVKMVRDSIYNPRLENEYRALVWLHEEGIGALETLPAVAFWGYHNGLAIIGETAIEGAPFRERTTYTETCPYLHSVLDWFVQLGATTADHSAATSQKAAEVLQTLLDRFNEIYHLTTEQKAFLSEQLAIIAHNHRSFPLVFQHGDPGTWNIMATPGQSVALLDWEAAEPQGIPLWDLFYFMRSYCVGAARTQGIHDRLQGFTKLFLADTPLSRVMLDTMERYSTRIGLESALIEPLFYLCWVHRALKEATRLSPSRVDAGHYVNLLRLCIEQRRGALSGGLFPVAESRAASSDIGSRICQIKTWN